MNGTVRMPFDTDEHVKGRLVMGGPERISGSTHEVKENIAVTNLTVKHFFMLRPRIFRWKRGLGGGKDVGLVAEEDDSELMPNLWNYGYKKTFMIAKQVLTKKIHLGMPFLIQQFIWPEC